MPEAKFVSGADSYLILLAPLFGKIKSLPNYQTLKRFHAQNLLKQRPYSERLKRYQFRINLLQEYLQKQGIELSEPLKRWKSPYYQHLQRMVQISKELEPFIPPGHRYILVDLNQWVPCQLLAKATSIPFLEKNGLYWGLPPDSETAIEELRRSRRNGASFIVFGQPAFWYFDHYTKFNRYLRTQFPCLLDSDRLVIFDLR
jgi:hypothetical protein